MCEESGLHLCPVGCRAERGEPAEDSGGAEPALAGPVASERVDQPAADLRLETGGSDNRPAGYPAHCGHACHPRRAVYENRAATTLALRAATVLDRLANAQVLPERAQ